MNTSTLKNVWIQSWIHMFRSIWSPNQPSSLSDPPKWPIKLENSLKSLWRTIPWEIRATGKSNPLKFCETFDMLYIICIHSNLNDNWHNDIFAVTSVFTFRANEVWDHLTDLNSLQIEYEWKNETLSDPKLSLIWSFINIIHFIFDEK